MMNLSCNISHEKLIKSMKINPALPCTKSCNAIGRYIIKHAVNINSEGFSIFTHDDIPKEIIKGIHAML